MADPGSAGRFSLASAGVDGNWGFGLVGGETTARPCTAAMPGTQTSASRWQPPSRLLHRHSSEAHVAPFSKLQLNLQPLYPGGDVVTPETWKWSRQDESDGDGV